MKNYKIRKKLLISFGSLGILILVMCIVAFYSLLETNIRLETMYTNNLIASNAVGGMREIYQHERSVSRDIVLLDAVNSSTLDAVSSVTVDAVSTDTVDAVSSPTMVFVEKLEELDKKMLENFNVYESTINTQENSEIFEGLWQPLKMVLK